MTSMRIYSVKENFTKKQKKLPITEEHIREVRARFGPIVAMQFFRDYNSGFPLWDSASMIEQSWDAFMKSDYVPPVNEWVRWTFEKIGYEEKR